MTAYWRESEAPGSIAAGRNFLIESEPEADG
jgi:hypothetical protein